MLDIVTMFMLLFMRTMLILFNISNSHFINLGGFCLRVLIGCEESQTECLAFRARGHEAYSCDIQECSGGHPEWHIHDDVLNHFNDGWDLMILHPPCTFLSNAGANCLRKNGVIQVDRYLAGLEARAFFLKCLDAPCKRVCVENPSPSRFWDLPEASQFVEPYMFGDPYKKRTLLWLRGLPLLMATDVCIPEYRWVGSTNHCRGIRKSPMPGMSFRSSNMRSKAFPGMASAMAAQWGDGIYFSV